MRAGHGRAADDRVVLPAGLTRADHRVMLGERVVGRVAGEDRVSGCCNVGLEKIQVALVGAPRGAVHHGRCRHGGVLDGLHIAQSAGGRGCIG